MRLPAALLVLLLTLAGAWFGFRRLPERSGLAASESAAAESRLELAGDPADASAREPAAGAFTVPEPATADAPRPEPPAERGACVEALTLAGLVLDEGAQDADFERTFAALPRDERVLARHRIRKLFAAGQEDAQAVRALVPGAAEIDLLARELRWLSANLAAEPADPLALLRVPPLRGAGDPDSIARQYAGACDEELAREHDALLCALAVENDRGLAERIAAGQYRVRQQPGVG